MNERSTLAPRRAQRPLCPDALIAALSRIPLSLLAEMTVAVMAKVEAGSDYHLGVLNLFTNELERRAA